MKTIVVGIGNTLLGDDGVGIHVIRDLKQKKMLPAHVTLDEASTGGMNLLDVVRGFDKVILVDAVTCHHGGHGDVHRYQLTDLPTIHSHNPHDVSFQEALQLAKQLGDKHLPKDITIIGIHLDYIPREFCDTLTPKIKQSIPKAIDMILTELQT